jgi:hypothetical protein
MIQKSLNCANYVIHGIQRIAEGTKKDLIMKMAIPCYLPFPDGVHIKRGREALLLFLRGRPAPEKELFYVFADPMG